MTLDELEKALETPTPELIEELSRRVHEEQGNNPCYPALAPYDEQQTDNDDPCVKCKKPLYTHKPIPDYTRPENWWPLAVKCRATIMPTLDGKRVSVTYFIEKNEILTRETISRVIDETGIAVCLAYLKVEEKKDAI